jgi:hypothetical protein
MKWKPLVAGLAMVLVAATPAGAAVKDPFIRTFPDLPGFTTPTQQQIADLAQRQLDPNADAQNNEGLTSGFTYFGQFLDHDLTLDTSPPPTGPVDPTTLVNRRTFAFDLDSVYGDGPTGSPQLYAADGQHLLYQERNVNGVRDLARRADGSAILAEGRNDENQIIAQIQVTFIRAHNRLVDSGLSFADARATLRAYYRKAIVNDFIPHSLAPVSAQLVKKLEPKKKGTPIEFSVAAYRFGHSQVRLAYRFNATNNCQNLQVFSLTAPAASLMGGRTIQAGRQIDWGMFFTDFPQPVGCAGVQPRNLSRQIDPLISASLFRLPIPGAEATGDNVLAFRNMSRAGFYGLPSGQSVAKSLGLPVISAASLNLGPGFETGTPLWYYILAESQQQGGRVLGPTGSVIVRAGFQSAITNAEKAETGSAKTVPALPGSDNVMTVADLFVFAGVAAR